jgi:hypothetical protein
MTRRTLAASVGSGFAALALVTGLAQADHVRIGPRTSTTTTEVVVPAELPGTPGQTTVVMPPTGAVTTPTTVVAPQTLQADEIKAHHVRANTIYANRIEADRIQGLLYQTSGVKVKAHGEIKAPEVTASVIYADSINANSVVADNIYVKDLKMK